MSDSEELTDHLARLGSSQLPLASGLRAAARECRRPRVAKALEMIASRVDQGEPLQQVVASSPELLPRHVGGLVVAASRTGQFGSALAELLEHQTAMRALRQSIARGLAYPVFVGCLALLLLSFALFWVSVAFRSMFEDFGMELPLSTQLLFWWRDHGVWALLAATLIFLVCLFLARWALGAERWSRVMARIPFLGRLWLWSGLAEWCGLASVLLKHQIPLPEALRLSASGVGNSHVANVALSLATDVEQGNSLAESLSSRSSLPVSLVPLMRWGEKAGPLYEAFSTARELFDRRIRIRTLLLQSILPPVLFVLIACAIGFVIVALFAPLFNMVSALA